MPRKLSMTASAVNKRERRRTDPEFARKDREASLAWKVANRAACRAYDAQYALDHQGVCETCGGPTFVDNASGFCETCILAGRRLRESLIVEWWAEGHSIKKIAELLGATPGSVGVQIVNMRAAGFDIPYRYNVRGASRVPA